jgi:hypothetical protein
MKEKKKIEKDFKRAGNRTFKQTLETARQIRKETMKFDCKNLQHDFKHLKRCGRANWQCPVCKKDVILLLVLAHESGIDLTK